MPEEAQQEPGARIRPQPIEEEMQRSYIDYAMSVIVGRALPDARDGLKPVQRRILHAMNELGMSSGSQFKKSARVVGECFVEGTLVATERGLVPIEKVTRDDQVFTETDLRRVIELYEMPPRSVVTVELENGMRASATRSQEFRVVRPDLSFEWKAASDLRPGDWVVLRSAFAQSMSDLPKLPPYGGTEMRLSRGLAYLLGQLMSDVHVSNEGKRNRVGFASVDRRVMERIQEILGDEFGHRPSIETREPRNPKHKRIYSVRINRDSINEYLVRTFGLRGIWAPTKFVPEVVLRSPRAVALAFVSGLIDGDGCVATSRRVVQYRSTSESLIDRVQVLLHHMGYHAKRYWTEPNPGRFSTVNGRRVVGRLDFHSLEVTSAEAWKLANELDLANGGKRGRLRKLRPSGRVLPQDADVLPFGSGVVFSELSKAHIGSGWFIGLDGRKFRQSIVHQSGTKIRYPINLQSMPLHQGQIRAWGILGKLERIGSPIVSVLSVVRDAGLSFVRVRSVLPAGRKRTYDIGVEGDHRFVANGMVVHNCLGKFHPHGDTAIYDALARMVQDFSLRYPLVQGQGNWGSTEDEPAAMRYTESRLSKIAEELLQDIEKGTVEWADNFDGTLKEPTVLPAKVPNLLVNGSTGIAVGMATNMPPHNLGEIVDGLIVLIDKPNATLSDLYNPETGPIRGPDFPTGGVLYGVAGVTEAYSTGRGLVSVRAKAAFEEAKGDKVRIVITEIPYFVNKGSLVESIAVLVKAKRIDGVTDLRDESDQEGMRIVLELKRDAIEDVVLRQLYHHTQMDSTFGIINLALVDGQPKVLGLHELLQSYVDYRIEVVRRRTQFDLNRARQREHIVEGLLTAIDHLDDVIRVVRRARDGEDASNQLQTRYLLSEDQAKAILDMSIRKLTGLETQALRTEQDDLKKTITDLEGILGSKERVLEIIKTELRELKEKYGDPRRTSIEVHAQEMEVEDLIPEENNVIVVTNSHYVKRIPFTEYRLQERAGKGTIGIETKEEDFVVDAFVASTHDYLLCFTTAGKVFWLKAFRIPKASRYARGKPIINLIERLPPGEAITAMIPVREFSDEEYLVFATRLGVVKRTLLSSYGRPMVTGIRAIRLREGDEVVDVLKVGTSDELIVVKSGGRAVRFPVMDVRDVSRDSIGVRGVKLREGDRVAAMVVAADGRFLLTVSANGSAKRTPIQYDLEKSKGFPTRARAGLGVIAMRVSAKTGPVVDALTVAEADELLASTKKGMTIRCSAEAISEQGRIASGVRLIRLDEGDEVVTVAHLAKEEGETETANPAPTPPP